MLVQPHLICDLNLLSKDVTLAQILLKRVKFGV